eukprot:s128_g34.t3
MAHCPFLGLGELTKELICCLPVDDVFRLSLASAACGGLCRVALRTLRLQAFGPAAAEALLRLVALQITDQGASIVEIDAAFCRSITNEPGHVQSYMLFAPRCDTSNGFKTSGTETLKALPVLPALEILNLDGCQDVDDEGLIAVAQRCRSLRSFSIYWNVKATDEGIGKVLRAQPCGNLQELCFSGCKLLTDATVQRVVGRATNLQRLDLTRCPRVTEMGITLICETLPELRVLRLYAMSQLSAESFLSLQKLPLLEELDLCGCRAEDAAVEAFLAAAEPGALKILNLTWCPALTDVSMLAVAKHCTRLTWLSFFGNLNITATAVEALAAAPCGTTLRALDLRGLQHRTETASPSGRFSRRSWRQSCTTKSVRSPSTRLQCCGLWRSSRAKKEAEKRLVGSQRRNALVSCRRWIAIVDLQYEMSMAGDAGSWLLHMLSVTDRALELYCHANVNVAACTLCEVVEWPRSSSYFLLEDPYDSVPCCFRHRLSLIWPWVALVVQLCGFCLRRNFDKRRWGQVLQR